MNLIKYFGGKGNGLYNKIINFFPENFKVYIEPFGGAGTVLLCKRPSPVEIYNDLEQNVYSLFKVMQDPALFQKFKEKLDLTPYSHELSQEFARDLKEKFIEDVIERAYKYFYVNRTRINGIGGFSVNYVVRRNMSKSISDYLSAIDMLPQIHQRLSRVIIENKDGIELIKENDNEDTFVYADPPYHWDTRTSTRYKQDMNRNEQKNLIDTLLGLKKARILLSGYDCNEYERLCSNGWTRIDFEVKTVSGDNNKPKVKIESVWRNYSSEQHTLFGGTYK